MPKRSTKAVNDDEHAKKKIKIEETDTNKVNVTNVPGTSRALYENIPEKVTTTNIESKNDNGAARAMNTGKYKPEAITDRYNFNYWSKIDNKSESVTVVEINNSLRINQLLTIGKM